MRNDATGDWLAKDRWLRAGWERAEGSDGECLGDCAAVGHLSCSEGNCADLTGLPEVDLDPRLVPVAGRGPLAREVAVDRVVGREGVREL